MRNRDTKKKRRFYWDIDDALEGVIAVAIVMAGFCAIAAFGGLIAHLIIVSDLPDWLKCILLLG